VHFSSSVTFRMGEILSTIGKWIKTRYEEVTSTLKEAWGVVKSVVEGVMDVVRRVVDAVSCFRYTNETVWVQSETTGAGGDTRKTRVEVCLPSLNLSHHLRDYLLITAVYLLAYTTNLRIPL